MSLPPLPSINRDDWSEWASRNKLASAFNIFPLPDGKFIVEPPHYLGETSVVEAEALPQIIRALHMLQARHFKRAEQEWLENQPKPKYLKVDL
jgi:hypothetical protein